MVHASLSEHLQSLEVFLFDPIARRDIVAVANLLMDEFREFGSSGRIYTKPDILAELTAEQPVVITLSDFTCNLVAPTVALATYKSLSSHERRLPTQALRSSLWVHIPHDPSSTVEPHTNDNWRMLFHQGTRF